MHLFPNEKNSFLWTPKAYFPSTPGHFLEGGLKSSSVTHFKLLTFIHNFVLQFTLVMRAAGTQSYEETNICDNQSSPKESTVTFHRQRTFHEIKTFLSINLIMQIISRCRSSTHVHSWTCRTLGVRLWRNADLLEGSQRFEFYCQLCCHRSWFIVRGTTVIFCPPISPYLP